MTHEKYSGSARSRAINETIEAIDDKQYAPLDTTTMSGYGLFEHHHSSGHRLSGGWLVQDESDDGEDSTDGLMGNAKNATERARAKARTASTTNTSTQTMQIDLASRYTQTEDDESYINHRPTKRARITFYHFAAQTRLQEHHERRRRSLGQRKEVLQKSIALSARLRRAGAWVQDGLVEISKQQDTTAFTRVFSHVHDLVDVCYSHWNNEIRSLDTVLSSEHIAVQPLSTPAFFDQLHPRAQTDLLDLLSTLRGNPRFLVDKLSHLPLSQVATLTAKPRWEASESMLASLSQHSGGSSQRRRRINQFSKELEDYASCFERSDPLSFLLHNIYSHDVSPEAPESRLRLFTWSTVCAELMQSGFESYGSLYWQVFQAFSSMQDWPARPRIELFLMDVLQRGAFLIHENTSQRTKLSLNTGPAHEFFESAVQDLYWTLIKCNTGCYPTGALALARAILGKLPTERLQSDFRAHFFQNWFLNHFLKAAITFPENENMLLKIHVSKRARDYILAPLFMRFAAKFEDFMDPEPNVEDNIRYIIMDMINMLEEEPAPNPYQDQSGNAQSSSIRTANSPMLVICASEVAKILDTLSPQAIYSAHYMSDGVMRGMGNAFQATYSRPNTRFDLLKQSLMSLSEPGTSSKDIHPCLEAWTQFCIAGNGTVARTPQLDIANTLEQLSGNPKLTLHQQALYRLCNDSLQSSTNTTVNSVPQWSTESSLVDLFQLRMDQSQAETHTTDFIFWKKALLQVQRQFPLTTLRRDDTSVLLKPLQHIEKLRIADTEYCTILEGCLGLFEKAYSNMRKGIDNFTSGLEELRLKLWYTSEVVHSRGYLDARNISSALSYMNTSNLSTTTNLNTPGKPSLRPSSSRSVASSIFGQPQSGTIDLLKAPTDQGGPRKLAHSQIETIKQWLQQQNIDNFCKGEERLHRFCMEIWLLSKKLTGETIMESQELWSSELFSRERSFYDQISYGISSAPASTRPASVMSEPSSMSATFPSLRPGFRSVDSDIRSTLSDERSSIRRGSVYGLFQRSLNPQLLTPSLASSMGSHGRTSSATTNASEIFSQPSQSVTSASVYSRPGSIMQGGLPNFAPRHTSSINEKKRFRQQLRKGLVCLLLSDLGSLVWGLGCETDAWITNVQNNATIMTTLEKRLRSEAFQYPDKLPPPDIKRRWSTTEVERDTNMDTDGGVLPVAPEPKQEEVDYLAALSDTLHRLSQHIDPISKLQACVDFNSLALEQLRALSNSTGKLSRSRNTHRRNSVDTKAASWEQATIEGLADLSVTDMRSNISERQLMHHFEEQLAILRPGSLFRDLQYIAVFTPQELLERTPSGKAFMLLGMAALEYKDQLCGSLVDIADRIVAADAIKRHRSVDKPESHLSRAAEYWKIAALEGNAVAQRELGLLYLMHPEILPVVTFPLAPSTEIFKDDMMWRQKVGDNNNRQALCLALHWMQQAARKGDNIALRKLNERGDRGDSTSPR